MLKMNNKSGGLEIHADEFIADEVNRVKVIQMA